MSAPVAPDISGLLDGSSAQSLEKVRGKNYPAADATDERKDAFVRQLLGDTEADALARYKQAAHNTLFANGRQHIGWKQSRRQWEDLPLAEGDLRVTMNYIIVILRARIQRMVSSEINWRGVPEDNSLEAHDRTKVGVNLIKARYSSVEMENKIRSGLMQSSVTGVCALKSFWNPSIGPLTPATMIVNQQQVDPATGQPLMDAPPVPQEVYVNGQGQPVQSADQAFCYRPGDTDTSLRSVFNVRVNPEATGWTEAEGLRWLIDEEIVPLSVAKERYPKIADKVKPLDSPVSSLTYERMAKGSVVNRPGMIYTTSPQAGSTRQTDASQVTSIREYWEMRSAFFPQGRLIAIVGGAVAYDGGWPQGVFPYAPLFGETGLLTPYGRPPMNDMLSPQTVINREWTSIARESGANGAGQWVAWAIPGVPDQIPRDEYAIMQIPARSMLANRPIRDVIQRMDPAVVSPDRWRQIQEAKAAIFDIGAYHEVSRGQIPPGLDSGVAIQYLLEQESAQLKDAVDALKRSLILWARHQLAIARWGYGDGAGRWIPVDRPDLGFMIHSLKGVSLPDPETMGLDIEYFRPQSEAATRGEVKELLSMGVIDPRKAMKIMDLGTGFEEAFESQTRHYAKARKENLDFETGQYVEVMGPMGPECMHLDPASQQPYPFLFPQDDDHAIHIDVHLEVALDETKPWPMREKVLTHIAGHRMLLQQMQMAAAAAAAPPPSEEGGSGESGSQAA